MTVSSSNNHTERARLAIGAILDGNAPNGTTPADLGQYGECFGEMLQAYQAGGTAAAQRVFVAYADNDRDVAALRAADPEPPKTAWTADELLTATFPEPRWTIPQILPSGLGFLVARPKIGKSWLALQIGMAVGSGGRTLDREVARGRVLYLALEDGPRRLQNRLLKQRTQRGAQVDFRFDWEPLTGQGTVDLLTAIRRENYSLVVIDTLSRALGRADQMDLADMNMAVGSLQRIAVNEDVTLLLVDHLRKSAGNDTAGDVVDGVMGSTSKTAVADVVLGIYRERGQRNAVLKMTGRDVEEQEFAINFDSEIGCWQMLGNAGDVIKGSRQTQVLDVIKALGAPTNSEIAEAAGMDRSNCFKTVQELRLQGRVREVPKSKPMRYMATTDQETGQK